MMENLIRIVVVSILALAVSYLSDLVSEPPPSSATLEYQKDYESAADDLLSQEEFEKLKEREKQYVEELTSPENMRADLEHIVQSKAIAVPVALCVLFLLGFFLGVKDKRYLFAPVVAVFLLPLVFVNILEALLYGVVFLVGNFLFLRKASKKNVDKNNMG